MSTLKQGRDSGLRSYNPRLQGLLTRSLHLTDAVLSLWYPAASLASLDSCLCTHWWTRRSCGTSTPQARADVDGSQRVPPLRHKLAQITSTVGSATRECVRRRLRSSPIRGSDPPGIERLFGVIGHRTQRNCGRLADQPPANGPTSSGMKRRDANVDEECLDISSANVGCLVPHLMSGVG